MVKLKLLAPIFLVLVIALFFRIWNLSSYPVHLSIDEVGIGYNAYSILKTGKDEHGKPFPLAFKSVGDYKPPINIYLTVPSLAILGLNEFAVRLPVTLLGAFTALIFILVVRELGFGWPASVFSGFWLAVLPWHIHFSRASFEAVTALFFMTLGLWCFLRWTKKKKQSLFNLTIVFFGLSIWSYHAERFFVPILIASLFFIFKDKIKHFKMNKRNLLLSLVILAFFAIPFVYLTVFTPAIATRAASTSILRETSLSQNLHRGSYLTLQELIFGNDFYIVFRHWVGKYLNYFDVRFWFWKGMQFTPPGYPDLGLLYLVDLPLFLVGIYSLAVSKNKIFRNLAFVWFFIGPLPASFTMNEQHPLRILVWLPFFGLVLAGSFEFLWKRLGKSRVYVFGGYFILLFLNTLYFKDIYTNHFPRFFSEYWQYGYKEIAHFVCNNKKRYDKILITETFGSYGPLTTSVPYAYFLFYCQYDPSKYLITKNSGRLENIEFRRPNWRDIIQPKNSLLIGSPWDLPQDKTQADRIIKKINFLNGNLGFIFIETREDGKI